MAYLDDKIVRGGEITEAKKFSEMAFYVMLVPKSADAASVAVMSANLTYNKGYSDFPFAVGVWNPVVLSGLDVKSSDLTNYRIFWGSEA